MPTVVKQASLKDYYHFIIHHRRSPLKFFLDLSLEKKIAGVVSGTMFLAKITSPFCAPARSFTRGYKEGWSPLKIGKILKSDSKIEQIGAIFAWISILMICVRTLPLAKKYAHIISYNIHSGRGRII